MRVNRLIVGVIALSSVMLGSWRFLGNARENKPALFRPITDPQPAGLPMRVNENMIVPLRALADQDLQAELDEIVAGNKEWAALASNKKLCIGLVDLRQRENVKYASVNGEHMMYAASLPKIAVLLAATDAIEKGEIEETDEVKSDMRQMIAKSNNAATTRMIDRIGLDKIAEVMQDPRYEFYDEETGGGLWVGKRYASGGARVGDPLKNISHGASAAQVCRFYYLLAYGQLVNFDRSSQMLSYLSDPELHHKFVSTIDQVAPKAKVYRKSGSWQDYHSDSALIWGPSWRRYILVALVQDDDGEKIMRQLIFEVDKTLKPKL